MSENRLPDYLEHIHQAAADARSFVDGMPKEAFLDDKRTQRAVIMSLIIIGEAATKVMDGYTSFIQAHPEVPRRSMRNMRNRMAHGFRHQPRCRVGDHPGVATGAAGATAGRTRGRCRRHLQLRMSGM